MQFDLASSTFGEEERAVIQEVIDSDRFTMGPRVAAFESEFAAYFGRRYAVMANSGSSANLIAVAALCHRGKRPLSPGDEVIVPCIAWATTYMPLQQYGLHLKFVDVDLHTLNYDMNALRDAVSPKTRMIVAVSILGNPCPFKEITALCQERDIILFEDNCESMGATVEDKYTGTFGVVGTFSTFFSHHISTIEGGLALTDDFELFCLMRAIRNHGWTRDQPSGSPIYTPTPDDFFEAYRFILPGYNVRPQEINGALGSLQLKKLAGFLETRRENARYFQQAFQSQRHFIIQKEHGRSSWFSFTMIVNPESGLTRAHVLELLKKNQVDHRIITGGNFLRHDAIRFFNHEVHSRTNADLAHDRGFFVGNHPKDFKRQIDKLYEVLGQL